MGARENMTAREWFGFLLREEVRYKEWNNILRRFSDNKEAILEAFIQMNEVPGNDRELIPVISALIEDYYMYFEGVHLYREAVAICSNIPREYSDNEPNFP